MRLSTLDLPPAARLCLCALAALIALTGCPRNARRTLVPEVPTSGDAQARARFQQAHRQFERDASYGTAEFEAIAAEYPDDPIAPYAKLYAGISAFHGGDQTRAIDNLTALHQDPQLPEGLRVRAALFLGIAHNYEGRHDVAVPLLRAGEPAIENDRERGEWLAAMAVALGASPTPLAAAPYFDQWYESASEPEKAYIVSRLHEVVTGRPADEVASAYAALEGKRGLAAAILGERVAGDLAAAGKADEAARVRAEVGAARERLGLPTGPRRADAGDPGVLGAALPLTGKSGRRGDLVVRGLSLAAGTYDGRPGAGVTAGGVPAPFALSVRDTGSNETGAADAVAAVTAEDAIAVVGPIDGDSVDAAGARADALGIPLLSLNPRPGLRGETASPFVFHVVHSAEARARSLARYAYQNGVRDFAILRPDSGYGRAVAGAFAEEVAALGGQVITEVTYERDATSFVDVMPRLRKPWQALFVPEQARRLELIAPALAAANLVSLPVRADKPRRGRKILLLSTAEFIEPRYLRSAGRYSEGAVLAPGFYPDRSDRLIADFVDRYEASFGRAPTALDAYGYDAALAVRAVVEEGARTRADVAAALAMLRVRGVTGTIGFDGSRKRADDGVLFTVTKGETDEYVIAAMRD